MQLAKVQQQNEWKKKPGHGSSPPPLPNFRVDLKISDQNNMLYSNKAFLQQVQEIF